MGETMNRYEREMGIVRGRDRYALRKSINPRLTDYYVDDLRLARALTVCTEADGSLMRVAADGTKRRLLETMPHNVLTSIAVLIRAQLQEPVRLP